MFVRRTRVALTSLAIAAFAFAGIGRFASPARADTPPLKPIASMQEKLDAEQLFINQLGMATTVGGLGGTAVGAVLGCAVGGVTLLPTVVFAVPGCIAGGVTGAGVGGVLGTLGVGGPALLIAGANLAATLTAAPGTTKFADK